MYFQESFQSWWTWIVWIVWYNKVDQDLYNSRKNNMLAKVMIIEEHGFDWVPISDKAKLDMRMENIGSRVK